MAERPEIHPSREILSRQDLLELQKRLATMSLTGIRDLYRTAYFRCQLKDNAVPSARDVQELVQTWKELRKGAVKR